jgi:hypothetical protein
MVLIPLSIEKRVFPACSVSSPSHLTSCTPTKSNIVPSKLSLGSKLLTFHTTNLYSILNCLGRLSKESVQVQGSCKFIFYGEGLLAPHPTPKLEDHPLSFVRGLFNIFAATLLYYRRKLVRIMPVVKPRNTFRILEILFMWFEILFFNVNTYIH